MLAELKAAAAPYMLLIRIALWAALAGALFISGCRHGVTTTRNEARAALAEAERAASDNLAAANACGQAIADVTAEADRAKAAAAALQAQAEQAAAQAAKDSAAAKARAEIAAKALQAAKSTPACKAQLEMELCASIPVL